MRAWGPPGSQVLVGSPDRELCWVIKGDTLRTSIANCLSCVSDALMGSALEK
jgi:hypothetical protein